MDRRTFVAGTAGALLLAAGGTKLWISSVGSMTAYEDQARRLRAALTAPPQVRDLVRYATLAANGHNTQPWRFRIDDGLIDIVPDFSRRTPAVDPDDHHLYVSLGCAAENLAIAASATGWRGNARVSGTDARHAFPSATMNLARLHAAIPRRQSTRAEYDGRPVPASHLALLEHTAATPGVHVALLTDRRQLAKVRDLVVAANTMQMADPAFAQELAQWIRFNPRSAVISGDGLFSAASGNPVLPDALGRFAFDRFFTARAEGEKYARHVDSSAGIAVFVGEREDASHWIKVGQACQRFLLASTALGIDVAFINQPVEVARFRKEIAALAGDAGRRPDLVVRFGYGAKLPFSLRRPPSAVPRYPSR